MFEGKTDTPSTAEESGLIVQVARTATDVSDDGCRLVWTWLDASGPSPVADPALVSQRAPHVKPDARSCSTNARVWVPLSASLAGYDHLAIRIELYADEHLLGSDVTETIPLG